MIAGLWAALKGWSIWRRLGALASRAGHWLMGDFWRVAALIAAERGISIEDAGTLRPRAPFKPL